MSLEELQEMMRLLSFLFVVLFAIRYRKISKNKVLLVTEIYDLEATLFSGN